MNGVPQHQARRLRRGEVRLELLDPAADSWKIAVRDLGGPTEHAGAARMVFLGAQLLLARDHLADRGDGRLLIFPALAQRTRLLPHRRELAREPAAAQLRALAFLALPSACSAVATSEGTLSASSLSWLAASSIRSIALSGR